MRQKSCSIRYKNANCSRLFFSESRSEKENCQFRGQLSNHFCQISVTVKKLSNFIQSDQPIQTLTSSSPFQIRCQIIQRSHVQLIALTCFRRRWRSFQRFRLRVKKQRKTLKQDGEKTHVQRKKNSSEVHIRGYLCTSEVKEVNQKFALRNSPKVL